MRAYRRTESKWVCVPLLVGAIGAALCWPAVASATTTLDPPTDLHQSNQTETSVTVSWTPSDSPGVTGYEIWPYGGAEVDVDPGVTSYTITGLACGNAAWIEVSAFDAAGDVSPAASTAVPDAPCEADLQVLSDTPSVTHAQVGQNVTFTIVARNDGPFDTVYPAVNATFLWDGLNFDGPVTCSGDAAGGNDGGQCEYEALAPGATVTETIVAQVQDTSTGYATDVACVHALERNLDPETTNDCGIAMVAIDHPAASPVSSVVSPAGPPASSSASGGAVTAVPTVLTGAGARSCGAYTIVHVVRSGHGTARHTIRVQRIFPGALNCSATRVLIRHADAAFTRARLGANIRIWPWLCREVRSGSMWVGSCKRSGGDRVSWTETREVSIRGKETARMRGPFN